MNMKNVIFLAAAISCNMSSIMQAYEESLKQTPESQKVMINTCQNRLEALAEEEKYQYFHTNICWGGAAGGVLLILGGCLSQNKDQSSKATNGGIALLISSVLVGAGSVVNENYKAHYRRAERNSLLEQLSKVKK
jgi:hypothetical protein